MASGDTRRASNVDLDKAPPPPPSLSGPTNEMAGILGQGPEAQGMDAHTQTVATAMQIEQGIQQLSQTLPGFAPLAGQIVNVLRLGVAKGLQSIGTQGMSPAPGAGMPNTPQPLQQSQQPSPMSGGGPVPGMAPGTM